MRNIAFGYSSRCNIRCDHCVAAEGDIAESKMNIDTALWAIDQLAKAGVTGISFTAGEPFIYFTDLLQLINRCRKHNIYSRVVTNSFWAKDRNTAHNRLSQMKEAGLSQLRLSFSRWHQEHVAKENVVEAAQSCNALGICYFVSFVTDFSDIDAPYENFLRANQLKFFPEPLIYSGRAKYYLKEPIFTDYADNRCLMNCYLAPDLTMYACCDAGSQFTDTGVFLLGNLSATSAADLFRKTETDPLFHCIRTLGLSAMASYAGMSSKEIVRYRKCELCEKLVNNKTSLDELQKGARGELRHWHR